MREIAVRRAIIITSLLTLAACAESDPTPTIIADQPTNQDIDRTIRIQRWMDKHVVVCFDDKKFITHPAATGVTQLIDYDGRAIHCSAETKKGATEAAPQ